MSILDKAITFRDVLVIMGSVWLGFNLGKLLGKLIRWIFVNA